MSETDDRLRALEARCSGFACDFLRQLRNHPKFDALMDRLERIEGPIYRGDVEEALYQVSDPPL